jgi:hypothetical protein
MTQIIAILKSSPIAPPGNEMDDKIRPGNEIAAKVRSVIMVDFPFGTVSFHA